MSQRSNNLPSLHNSVEMSELFDVQDQDVGGYIQELINSCSSIPGTKRYDLSASEDAFAALAIVERAAGHIASRMKTVRALRAFLRSRHPDGEYDMQ